MAGAPRADEGWGSPFAAWSGGGSNGNDDAGSSNSRAIRWTALTLIFVGALGAVASATRPLLRRRVAAAARAASESESAIRLAAAAAAPSGAHSAAAAAREAAVAPLRVRLRDLQRAYAERHPLWFGRPTPEIIEEATAALATRSNLPMPPLPPLQ